MKNEFPISNLRAKYADKTADGKDIAEAIAESAKVYYTDKYPQDFTSDDINEVVDGNYSIINTNDLNYIVVWSSSNEEFGVMGYDVETSSIYRVWFEYNEGVWVKTLSTAETLANLDYVDEMIGLSQLARNIPELSNDTVQQIYNAKPKFIVYNGIYYVLEEFSEPDLYYVNLFNTSSNYIEIDCIVETGIYTISVNSAILATESYVDANKGTKLYQHLISFNSTVVVPGSLVEDAILPVYIISTRSMPYTYIDMGLQCGVNGVIDISTEGMLRIGYMSVDTSDNTLYVYTGITDANIEFDGVSNFTDTVTPL